MAGISLFEVIGPNMVGPSSSHTAGAAAMALLASKLFGGILSEVEFTLYGSFAKTYKGHGTDRALLGGMLGFEPDDLRIKDAFALAKDAGISYRFLTAEDREQHPNTADMKLKSNDGQTLFVRGVSVGGGKVKIVKLNSIDVDFTGEYSTLVVSQNDRKGVAAHITSCLSDCDVNIAFMRLYREEKGANAFTVVESDEKIPKEAVEAIRKSKFVMDTMLIQL